MKIRGKEFYDYDRPDGKTELFKSFARIGDGDTYVDLHNEFSCYSIKFLLFESQLSLSFKASKNNLRKVKHVELIFKNVAITSMNFKIDDATDDAVWTIDMIYRGRFADANNELKEISNEGKYYYYIDFVNDYSFEVFSNSVIAELK